MATSAAGLAALALFVLVLGYWVPLRVRQRQELAEARVDDRFSAGLRVLAVGARGPVPALAGAPSMGAASSDRTGLLTGATPEVPIAGLLEMAATPLPITVPVRHDAREETPMAPPQTTARSSRRALLEARAKRARRRLTLTLVLFVATAAAWAAVPLTTLLWYGALVPTVLLAVVLGLGRAAAASARRSDARWAAEQRAAERRALQARALAAGGPRAPMNRARVTGRAVRGSSAMTQMLPRVTVKVVEGEAVEGRADRTAEADDAGVGVGVGVAAAGADRAGSTPGSADDAGRAADGATRAADDSSRGAAAARAADDAGRRAADGARSADGARAADGAGRSGGATPFAAPTLGRPWEPRPVPLPTYVTKQAAPHREPRPLTGATPPVSTGWSSSPWQRVEDAGEVVGEANTSWTLGPAHPAPSPSAPAPATPAPATSAPTTPAASDPLAAPEPRPTTETLGLPLDQILARRRAAG